MSEKTKTKKVGLMTEAEINQAIVDEFGRWLNYYRDLIGFMPQPRNGEAFLKTIGKWKE